MVQASHFFALKNEVQCTKPWTGGHEPMKERSKDILGKVCDYVLAPEVQDAKTCGSDNWRFLMSKHCYGYDILPYLRYLDT